MGRATKSRGHLTQGQLASVFNSAPNKKTLKRRRQETRRALGEAPNIDVEAHLAKLRPPLSIVDALDVAESEGLAGDEMISLAAKLTRLSEAEVQEQATALGLDLASNGGSTEGNGLMARTDLTGQRFGMLVAVKFIAATLPAKSGRSFWEFRCDCGRACVRPARLVKQAVSRGEPRSCGCALIRSQRSYAARNSQWNQRNITDRDRAAELWLCSGGFEFAIDEIYRAAHRIVVRAAARKVMD